MFVELIKKTFFITYGDRGAPEIGSQVQVLHLHLRESGPDTRATLSPPFF
jgi:hypothetical protein